MVIIGSTAINHWYNDFKRLPKDLDYAVEKSSSHKNIQGIEFLENPIILKYHNGGDYLSPELLATLKASHLCWDINWSKHMFDLQFLLSKGVKLNTPVFFELYDYWNTYHAKNKRSDLKMSKNDFFDNAINYNEQEHDFLHTLLNPNPVYTLVLKDGCDVELDENKFHQLTKEQKIQFVREEVMVMAWERYRNNDYRIAYSKMLKKFIINHAPMFSLLFIFENFKELHIPNINYIKTINHGLHKN